MSYERKCRMNGFSEAVIICKGNLGDPGFFLYLAKVKENLQHILETEKETFTVKKVEKWNSVKVTFNLPQHAAGRLRELARRSPSALEALGIHSVQVDDDQVISVILSDHSSITFSSQNILPSSVNGTTPPDSGIESSASTSGASADNNGLPGTSGDHQDVPPATIEAVKRSVIDYLQNQKHHQDPSACNEFRTPGSATAVRLPGRQVSSGSPSSQRMSPGWRPMEQGHQMYMEESVGEELFPERQSDNPVAGMENMVNSRNIVSNSPLLVNLLRSASPTGQGDPHVPIQHHFFPPPGSQQQFLGFPSSSMASAAHSQESVNQSSEPPAEPAVPTPPKKKRKQYKKKNQNNVETVPQSNAHTVARPPLPYQYPPGPGQEWYSPGYYPQESPVPYAPGFHPQYRHPQHQQSLDMGGGRPPVPWYPPPSSHQFDQQMGIQYSLPPQGPNPSLQSEQVSKNETPGPSSSSPTSASTSRPPDSPAPPRPSVPACPEHISQSIDAVLSQVNQDSSPSHNPDSSEKALMELERKRMMALNRFHLNNGPDCDIKLETAMSDSSSVRGLDSAGNSGSFGWQGRTQFNGPGPPPQDVMTSSSAVLRNNTLAVESCVEDLTETLSSSSLPESNGGIFGSGAALSVNGVLNGLSNGGRKTPEEELEGILGGPEAAIAVRTVHGRPRSPSAILALKERERTLVSALECSNGHQSPGRKKTVPTTNNNHKDPPPVPDAAPSAGLTIDILATMTRPDYFLRPSPSSISASSSTLSEPSPVPSEGSRTRSGRRKLERRSSVTSPTPSEEDSSRSRPRRKAAENSAEMTRQSLGGVKRARSRESSGGSSTASGRSSAAKRRGSSNSSSRGGSREPSADGPAEVFESSLSSKQRRGFEVPLDAVNNAGKTRSSKKKKVISTEGEQSGVDSSKRRNYSDPAANHAIAKAQSGGKTSRRKRES